MALNRVQKSYCYTNTTKSVNANGVASLTDIVAFCIHRFSSVMPLGLRAGSHVKC